MLEENIYNKPCGGNYMKKDFLPGATLVVSWLALGISISNYNKIKDFTDYQETQNHYFLGDNYRFFDEFEQNVSDKYLHLQYDQITVVDGHVGYQPVSIHNDGIGTYLGFSNNEEVLATYDDFGVLIRPEENTANEGEFLPYQHILIVPTGSPSITDDEIPSHDGYEMVFAFDEDQTYLLYVNTELVKCEEYWVDEGKTMSKEFGTPISKNKLLEKNSN